ncbi:phosphoribosylformylglycinamidine synthase I, partial [candidate division Kazan bacterium]
GFDVNYIWYKDGEDLDRLDVLVLPGGYTFGDYVMPGKLAALSRMGNKIRLFSEQDKLILGICNGCQILTHLRLIPGTFILNKSARFVQRYVYIKVEDDNSPFTSLFAKGEVIKLDIAHYSGAYYPQEHNDSFRVAFRYSTADGEVTEKSNPQGSFENIAGLLSANGKVLGMMPHPERAVDYLLGSVDGKKLFLSVLNWFEQRRR